MGWRTTSASIPYWHEYDLVIHFYYFIVCRIYFVGSLTEFFPNKEGANRVEGGGASEAEA